MLNPFKRKKQPQAEEPKQELNWDQIVEKTKKASFQFVWKNKVIFEIKPTVLHKIYLGVVILILLLLFRTLYRGFTAYNNNDVSNQLQNLKPIDLPSIEEQSVKIDYKALRRNAYDSLIDNNIFTVENIKTIDSLYPDSLCDCK